MPSSQAITSTTQEFLDIHDITDNLLLLKSGGAALIVQVTAMNFGLLAEEEQDAIIYGYAGLLNSLNYSIQIVIRSQTKDVTSYLNLLRQKEEEALSSARKEQIRQYREFVADLVQERNVLDKKFYVVIPASGIELGIVQAQSILPGIKNPDISSFDRSIIIERANNLLEPKRDHIMAQFARIGMFSRQLMTQEIIQLFYTAYNPEASDGQKMTDSRQYTSTAVEGNLEEKIFGSNRSQQPTNMIPMPEQAVQEMNASAAGVTTDYLATGEVAQDQSLDQQFVDPTTQQTMEQQQP
ncbi:hypothetical protein H3C66_00125 [Patescibacteria group bacterium]|nr:hypothetical protein [Patescibacteria group bacterium]